tara:strand:- start:505 stop:1725 length:1221 start_codon:yes stop_codon:yes gene_type:complete
MTELADALETKSTDLEPNVSPGVSGGGEVKDGGGDEPVSLRDTIAQEVKNADNPAPENEDKEAAADDADATKEPTGDKDGETKGEKDGKDKADTESKKADKADADDVKPAKQPAEKQRGDDGKFARKVDGEDDGKTGHYQPPKNLLPDAKEKWTNVPRAVQRDIDNMVRESETRVQQLTQQTERYQQLREFDELAQSNGRDLRESLTKLNEIENVFQQNPIAGLNAVLQELAPRKPDGSAVSLYEVAQYVAQQGPENWQKLAAPPQQEPQEDPRIAQLQQQLAQERVSNTAANVIEPFKASHPRYDELRAPIAQILKSGMVPASLSPADRLEAAYDMAERLNPSSGVASAPKPKAGPDADARVDEDSSGTKSIKSAPGSASPDLAPDRGGSTADILRDEMRRAKRT